MKKRFVFLIVLFITICLCLITSFNYKKVDYLVHIESINDVQLNSGNGIVYKQEDNASYVVTNYHIVTSSNSITIFDNKRKLEGTLMYYDDYTDIAVIKVNDVGFDVKKIKECNYKIGDKVYIKGIKNKSGFIVEKDVVIDVPNTYGNSRYRAIKFESNITYGDSGSALLDKKGNIIGIVSVMDKDSNYAYAIPICDAMNIVNKLEKGNLYRPNLKATFKNSESNINGVLVEKLHQTSILKESGIISGDIITKINYVETNNISEFRNELYRYNMNDKILLEYYRNNKYDTIYIILK